MGTGICLFWTGKMGFTVMGLNHWELDGAILKMRMGFLFFSHI